MDKEGRDPDRGARISGLMIDLYKAVEAMAEGLRPEQAVALYAECLARELFYENVMSNFQGAQVLEGVGGDASDALGCPETGKKGWPIPRSRKAG